MFITYYITIIINSRGKMKEKEYGKVNKKKWRWKIKKNTKWVWIANPAFILFQFKFHDQKWETFYQRWAPTDIQIVRNWFEFDLISTPQLHTNRRRTYIKSHSPRERERNERQVAFGQQQLLHTCIHLYTNTQKAFNSAVLPFRL